MSCSGNQKDAQERKYIPMNEVKDVMTNLKPLKTTFEISANEESVIQGDEGTVIYIPANSFEFADGTKPKGKIKIELKECYTNASIIGQGLHTNSQGSILASGGMIYIAAKSDGKNLEIKDGSALQIGFPKSDSKNEMDLFYSVKAPNGLTTWIPDYKMFELDQPIISEVSNEDAVTPLKYPIEITDDMYDFYIECSGGNSASLDAIISGTNTNMWDYLNDQKNSQVKFAEEFYRNNYRFFINFHIDQNGKMFNFRLADKDDGYYDENPPRYSEKAVQLYIDYLKKLPPFEVSSFTDGIRPGWDYSVGVSAYNGINWQKFKEKFRSKFQKSRNDASIKINGFELDNYVFAVTKLGWINCDRFLDIPDDQKTDFIVNSTEKSEQKIRLIFENNRGERTIMNGETKKGETIFKNVPIGQQITVLGIGLKNGTPTLAKSKTRISKSTFTLSNFKEVDIIELESELNRIN